MRRTRFAILAVLAASALLLTGRVGTAQEPPSDWKEQALWDSANVLFNCQQYEQAAGQFEEFVRTFPQSKAAPEALFKWAATFVMRRQGEVAGKLLQRLVREHPHSPWTCLAALGYLSPEQVLGLAKEKHARARETNLVEDAEAALVLFQVYGDRSLGGPPMMMQPASQAEVLYKFADCKLRLGDGPGCDKALEQLRAADRDGDWCKLLAIRQGDANVFRRRMEELVNLGVEEEGFLAFLELAPKYLPGLTGDDRARCLFYQARSLAGLKREKEASAVLQRVVQEHPSSAWAAAGAFWLAEQAFLAGEPAKARAAYEAMAARYPTSAYAARARAWAGGTEQLEALWNEFAQVLDEFLGRATRPVGTFALRLRRTSANPLWNFDFHTAIQTGRSGLIDVKWPAGGFRFVTNDAGTWYQPAGQGVLLHARQRIPLFLPRMQIYENPVTRRPSFLWGWPLFTPAPENTALLTAPPSAAALMFTDSKLGYHPSKQTRMDGAGRRPVTFCLEQARWDGDEPDRLEIDVDAGRKIQEVRLTHRVPGGDKVVWVASDIQVGEPIPDAVFAVPAPPGVAVREVEELDPMQAFGELMKALGILGNPKAGRATRGQAPAR
jgi:TolA-binding protein